MKKIITSLLLLSILFACTKEEKLFVTNDSSLDFTKNLEKFDYSSDGLYKGIFSTNESEYRGTLVIKIKDNNAKAILSVLNETPITFTGIFNDEGILFSANSLAKSLSSFMFKVEKDGANPIVTNAYYRNIDATILTAKETSFAPIVPITGQVSCFDCDNYSLMSTGPSGTFNLLFTGDGTTNDSVTAMVDIGTMVTLTGTQANCSGLGDVKCTITGNQKTIGNHIINWSGAHTYTTSGNCSEASGTWTVNNNGSLYNGHWISDPVCNNNSLEFNASVPQRVKYTTTSGDILDTKLNGATDYTIELWVKPTSTTISGNVLLKRWNQFAVTMFNNERFYFTHYDASGSPDAFVNTNHNVLTINAWNHLAIICNSTDNTIKLYVNGTDVTNDTETAADVVLDSSPSASNLYIGYGGNGTYFTGEIDKVNIRNVAEDINDLNTTDVNGTPYTIDKYTAVLYNFNEGSGYLTKNEADGLDAALQCNSGTCNGSENWWIDLLP